MIARATLVLVVLAGPVEAQEGLYKVCYRDMAVSLLLDVSGGATPEAAGAFADEWMAGNAGLLDAGFSTVVRTLLADLNIDERRFGDEITRSMARWRDCAKAAYEPRSP